jgi:hypothetical protein
LHRGVRYPKGAREEPRDPPREHLPPFAGETGMKALGAVAYLAKEGVRVDELIRGLA